MDVGRFELDLNEFALLDLQSLALNILRMV